MNSRDQQPGAVNSESSGKWLWQSWVGAGRLLNSLIPKSSNLAPGVSVAQVREMSED